MSRLQPRPDGLGRRVGYLALVTGDADQAQRVRRRDGVREVEALVLGAHARARALARAQLHDHVDRARRPGLGERGVHQLDAAHRVDVTDEAEAGVAVEFAREPAQGGRVDEFVREEDPLDAEGAGDPHLVRDGEGDAPRAVLDLAMEEPRRHRGLAVRCEGQAVASGICLHEREVVLEALGGECEDRGGEAAGEEVAALGRELADGQAFRVRGQPLEAVVDPLEIQIPEPGYGVDGAVGGHGASS